MLLEYDVLPSGCDVEVHIHLWLFSFVFVLFVFFFVFLNSLLYFYILVVFSSRVYPCAEILTDRSKRVLLLWFIFICYDIYNVCLLHDFVATIRLSALPSALYFILSKLAL